MNPMSLKEETFNSLDDVYQVLIQCYDKCINKGVSNLGKALYEQSLFICNDVLLLDKGKQNTIKKHQFCKQFNCPPFPSLNETPSHILDDFMTIEQEMRNIQLGELKDN